MVRAGITVAARFARRLMPLLADLILVYLSVAAVALLRSEQAGRAASPYFFTTVAVLYAVSAVTAIALARGYHRSNRRLVRPVLLGAVSGLLVVSAASFFFRDIAFSRAVVGFSFALIIPLLLLRRSVGRPRLPERRRAIVVGSAAEASRLRAMLARHPAPPFALEGYVPVVADGRDEDAASIPRLGSISQLRDLVRLRRISDVVFALEGVPNTGAFTTMQQLRDLPVQFRMLMEGREHLIGKASVENLAMPSLVEVDERTAERRSPLAKRMFELAVTLPALMIYPVLFVLAPVAGENSLPQRLLRRVRRAPSVVSGSLSLVGYTAPADAEVAKSLGLREGLFGALEGWPNDGPAHEERHLAYAFYARHQSAALDWSIILRTLNKRR